MQIPIVLTVQKNIEILQVQSIEKVVDVTVGQIQQIPRVLSVRRQPIPQLHSSFSFLDKVVDMPVVFNDKCPWVSVQKTAKVPQLQRSFKVADIPVVQVVMVPQVLSAVVNVPVIIQRRGDAVLEQGGVCPLLRRQVHWGRNCSSAGCERPCDHTATSSCLFNSRGASDSVHRQSRGRLVVQQRLVRGVMAAVGRGFSAALTHFSRSSGLSRS